MISAKPSKTRIRVITSEDGSITYEAQYKRYTAFDAFFFYGGNGYVAFERSGRAARELREKDLTNGWEGSLEYAQDLIDMHILQAHREKARRKAYKKPKFIKYP